MSSTVMCLKILNMKLYLLMLICIITTVKGIKEMLFNGKFCDLLSEATYKQCYTRETLVALPHSPNQLAVNNLTDTLFFSYDSGQGKYLPAMFSLETRQLNILKGVKDAFAIAHAPDTGATFFGGSHGIYKYNSKEKTLQRLKVTNLDVWWLVVKKRLYFIKFPSLKTYYYLNKKVKIVPELRNDAVNQFGFDVSDNIIFINSTGLYGVKHGEDRAVQIKDHPKFLSLAVDNFGNVHLSNDNGIYVVSRMVQKVKKLVSVTGVLGMTFDKDNNIIYSDAYEIVRLKIVTNSKT